MQNVTRSTDGFNLDITVNKMFTVCGDGLWSETEKEVYVESITMFIANSEDEGDGDLGVCYNTDTWNDEELGLIYTDSEFLHCVQTALIAAGISIEAAEDVCYSEQGMQDEGRVSCDAYALADYVRARMQNTVLA